MGSWRWRPLLLLALLPVAVQVHAANEVADSDPCEQRQNCSSCSHASPRCSWCGTSGSCHSTPLRLRSLIDAGTTLHVAYSNQEYEKSYGVEDQYGIVSSADEAQCGLWLWRENSCNHVGDYCKYSGSRCYRCAATAGCGYCYRREGQGECRAGTASSEIRIENGDSCAETGQWSFGTWAAAMRGQAWESGCEERCPSQTNLTASSGKVTFGQPQLQMAYAPGSDCTWSLRPSPWPDGWRLQLRLEFHSMASFQDQLSARVAGSRSALATAGCHLATPTEDCTPRWRSEASAADAVDVWFRSAGSAGSGLWSGSWTLSWSLEPKDGVLTTEDPAAGAVTASPDGAGGGTPWDSEQESTEKNTWTTTTAPFGFVKPTRSECSALTCPAYFGFWVAAVLLVAPTIMVFCFFCCRFNCQRQSRGRQRHSSGPEPQRVGLPRAVVTSLELLERENPSCRPRFHGSRLEDNLDLENPDLCSICLEALELGERVRNLPCGHLFHTSCIDAWLIEGGACALCRERIEMSAGPAQARGRLSFRPSDRLPRTVVPELSMPRHIYMHPRPRATNAMMVQSMPRASPESMPRASPGPPRGPSAPTATPAAAISARRVDNVEDVAMSTPTDDPPGAAAVPAGAPAAEGGPGGYDQAFIVV